MKANHNLAPSMWVDRLVVVNISKSKNESKSQQQSGNFNVSGVVVNISKSKNESKSQQSIVFFVLLEGCGQYQ